MRELALDMRHLIGNLVGMTNLIRRALVIASPYAISRRPLPGTLADLDGWERRLRSLRGGAWLSSEICSLIDPTPAEFRRAMRRIQEADVAYVFVSAHGATGTDVYGEVRNLVYLGRGYAVDLQELIPSRTTWSFTLVDACRNYSGTTKQAMYEVGGLGGLPRRPDPLRVFQHRQLFDALVLQVPEKHELALACSFDESAIEDPDRGGYFSLAMRGAAHLGPVDYGIEAWRTTHACFEDAAGAVEVGTRAEQQPLWFETPGIRRALPFAVAVGVPVQSRRPR